MSDLSSPGVSTPSKGALWTGRAITGLIAVMFLLSGVMKLKGGPDLAKNIAPLGLREVMIFPLGIVELACVALYVIPQTTIVGAILLTGYLGGAICTHWRVGDAFPIQVVLGVLVWIGVCLREPRLGWLFRR